MDIAKSSSGGLDRPHRLTRRAWHGRASLPMLAWAIVTILVVVNHRFLPVATWLMVHCTVLGIASNAIVVWSNHFADAVLRSRDRGHRREAVQLILLNTALVLLVAGVAGQWSILVWLAAALLVSLAATAVVGLARQARQSLPARFSMTIAWYQAAACCLVLGVVLGALMAVPFGRWSDVLLASHLVLNALGWIGLTILGTLATLWPTMLRTRAPEGVEQAAAKALPTALVGIAVCALAPFLHPVAPLWWRIIGALGMVTFLAAVLTQTGPMLAVWRSKRACTFPALSTGLGMAWLLGWLGWCVWLWMSSTSPAVMVGRLRPTVAVLLVGFVLQVLCGALAYLVPVVLGGGPAMVRTTTALFEKGAVARLAVVNLGLALFLLPITSVWKVTSSLAVFVALSLFVVRLVAARRARRRGLADERATHEPSPKRMGRGVAIGLAWLLATGVVALAVDPVSFKSMAGLTRSGSGVAATGQTTTVDIVAQNMTFTPDRIEVPAGNRLVIRLTNKDEGLTHDLILDTGATSGRLAPGESTEFDAGIIDGPTAGWCSVTGHQAMGMTFQVDVPGAQPSATAADTAQQASGPAAAPTFTPGRAYSAGWSPREARLDPAPATKLHRTTLRVTDEVMEVAPGVQQTMWTFNEQAPGPVLRGRIGDVFEITLVNDGGMGHSIDFHAGALAPDRPMRTIAPGESLVYRFTATRAGIWMYHCSTAPMSVHIANGMYGAVVIDPPDLPEVDREYILVQGEQYFGAEAEGAPGVADPAKIAQERPDAVVFNGHPNQYDHSPLAATAGERVRFWVLDAGPNRPLAFHIVGAQFDTVWSEGAWRLRRGASPGVSSGTDGGSQTLGLLASQGGFVETVFPEAGNYPMVNHQMVDAERGAHGIVTVS
ncbi:multicopper oxidase domain-containing protein [Luteococcus sediminum]